MAQAKPAPGPDGRSGPARILVVQTAFLGDIVLATPFLANLRALAPAAEIRLLTTPTGARILAPNGWDVTVISYDKRGRDAGFGGFVRLARRLREFSPELTFCLHRSLRSALLSRLAGGESYGFREAAGAVLFDHRVAREAGRFEAEKNQALLVAWARAAAAGQPVFPRLWTEEGGDAEADALLAPLAGEPFVAFAPSSVWATKRWPAARFARVAVRLWETRGLRTVVLGGNEAADVAAAAELAACFHAALPGAPPPLDLAGKTGLGGVKSVLARARLLIANDTGLLHVGIALGVPVVGVFGPTTRELGFFPLAPAGRAAVAEVAGLECRPCGQHGHDACPRGHFRCMLELSPDSVLKEAEPYL